MSEVKVHYSENVADNATLLLGAAEELGLEPYVVRTQSEPYYLVPREVAEKAGLDYESDDDEESAPEEDSAEEKKPAKKTAAKKTAAKKASSK